MLEKELLLAGFRPNDLMRRLIVDFGEKPERDQNEYSFRRKNTRPETGYLKQFRRIKKRLSDQKAFF